MLQIWTVNSRPGNFPGPNMLKVRLCIMDIHFAWTCEIEICRKHGPNTPMLRLCFPRRKVSLLLTGLPRVFWSAYQIFVICTAKNKAVLSTHAFQWLFFHFLSIICMAVITGEGMPVFPKFTYLLCHFSSSIPFYLKWWPHRVCIHSTLSLSPWCLPLFCCPG